MAHSSRTGVRPRDSGDEGGGVQPIGLEDTWDRGLRGWIWYVKMLRAWNSDAYTSAPEILRNGGLFKG